MRYALSVLFFCFAFSAQGQPWRRGTPEYRSVGQIKDMVEWVVQHDSTRIDTLSEVKRYLRHFTAAELRVLRNAVFADEGYQFDSSELRSYFNRYTWYAPAEGEIDLTRAEKANVRFFQGMEQEKRKEIRSFPKYFPTRSLPFQVDSALTARLHKSEIRDSGRNQIAPLIPARYVRNYLGDSEYAHEGFSARLSGAYARTYRAVAHLGRRDSVHVLIYERREATSGEQVFMLATFEPENGLVDRRKIGEFISYSDASVETNSKVEEDYVVTKKITETRWKDPGHTQIARRKTEKDQFAISLDGQIEER